MANIPKSDQVEINMSNLAPLATNEDVIDGTKRNGSKETTNRHRRNNSGSQHYSGDSDTDEYHHHHHHHNGRRRSRGSRGSSRGSSPSQSPSRRNKRNVDIGQTPQTEKDIGTTNNDVEPLLVTEKPRKTSQTELDEDSNDDENFHGSHPNPGVDDGFFVGNRAGEGGDGVEKEHPNSTNGNHGPLPPQNPAIFPFAPGYNPNVIIDSRGNPQAIPDINVYQQKKNLAQGMMDLALLSANANQLRYVLESYVRHPYYWFSLVSITISLILQVAVGVGLIWNSKYNVKNREQICRADKINNFTIIGIFLITIVNVFISAFGVADPPKDM